MTTERLPTRQAPPLYVVTVQVSLALAYALVVWSPRAVADFLYHSWIVAIVHLVTLGWITFSILGANLYRRSRGAGRPQQPAPGLSNETRLKSRSSRTNRWE